MIDTLPKSAMIGVNMKEIEKLIAKYRKHEALLKRQPESIYNAGRMREVRGILLDLEDAKHNMLNAPKETENN